MATPEDDHVELAHLSARVRAVVDALDVCEECFRVTECQEVKTENSVSWFCLECLMGTEKSKQ